MSPMILSFRLTNSKQAVENTTEEIHRSSLCTENVCYVGNVTTLVLQAWPYFANGWSGIVRYRIEGALSLSDGWDWYDLITRMIVCGSRISGYASELTLATILALAPAHERSSRPLSGPALMRVDQSTFDLAALLKRVGVGVTAAKAGRLKSQGLLSGIDSDAEGAIKDKSAVLELLGSTVRETIVESTGCSLDRIEQISSGAEAFHLGLLTRVGYDAAVPSAWVGSPLPRILSPRYRSRERRHRSLRRVVGGVARRAGVAIVRVRAMGYPGESTLTGAAQWILNNSDRYFSLIIEFDLSGGDLSEADEFREIVDRATLRIPVFGYIREARSAGYMASLGCSEIIANPAALVGGIGAVAVDVDLGQDVSLGAEAHRTEAFPQSNWVIQERRAALGAALFKARVRDARPSCGEDPLESGRLLSAHSALSFGLVDQVATLACLVERVCSSTDSEMISLASFRREPGQASSDLKAELLRQVLGVQD